MCRAMAAIKVTVLKRNQPTKVENVGHVHVPFRSLTGMRRALTWSEDSASISF